MAIEKTTNAKTPITRSAGMKSFAEAILASVALCALCLCFFTGCSATDTPATPATPVESESMDGLTAASVNPALEALWSARRADSHDFAVGPGDVLEILVPDVKELEDRTVRVDGKGDIDLPLLGSMHVAGLSEPELDSLLVKKLGDYVYHPEAQVFVKGYNNRQVSVTGEVRMPADYTLNAPDDTVGELIQRAGGLTQQASPEIMLTPGGGVAEPGTRPSERANGSYSAASYGSDSESPSNALGWTQANVEHPLIIDLSRNSRQGRYLNLPVRPGDVIFVPSAGQVSTVGWVYRTQTIPITHNLSVIGAVAASGGTLFAADEHHVRIVRRETDGQIGVMTVDIASIQAGKTPDVPLENGDIVDVPYSAAKIPGYALYYAMQGIVSYAPAAALVAGF
jgi:polysaccharide export outer membrane protein